MATPSVLAWQCKHGFLWPFTLVNVQGITAACNKYTMTNMCFHLLALASEISLASDC
jgi:hypothetical protein